MSKTAKKRRQSPDQDNEPAVFDPVPDVIDSIRRGEIVIVTDDERRENEGDFIFAAEKVSESAVNFLATHGRGLICVSADRGVLERLGLSRVQVRGSGDAFSTAFTESVDAADGISTGISARDRAQTISILASETSGAGDLVSPGHMFPIEAAAGGVLVRAGHTEASVDLARLAGLSPVGVICEILNEDGTMARVPELRAIANKFNLKMTSIAAMIDYRRRREKIVEFVREVQMPTEHGPFRLRLYHSCIDNEHHVALVKGNVAHDDPVMVRVHSECLTGDVFGSLRCDCGHQLREAMAMVSRETCGVVLYMRQEGRGIGLANKIHAYQLQEEGMDTVEANTSLGFDADLREYGVGAQILAELGIRKMRLITNNPRKVVGLEGYGLDIVERIPLVLPPNEHSEKYMQVKRDKLGHLLW